MAMVKKEMAVPTKSGSAYNNLVMGNAPDGQVIPSVTAQAAAGTAAADVLAAGNIVPLPRIDGNDVTPENRRQLWMKYLRTRQDDARGSGKKRAPKAGAPEKLPNDMATKVNNNLNYYFELWVQCGCSWGQVRIHEERCTEEQHTEDTEYDWTYGFDLKKHLPEEIAIGWMKAMKASGDPTVYRPDPYLKENDDAAMYKILRKHVEQFKRSDARKKAVSLTTSTDDMSTEGKLAAAQFAAGNGPLQIDAGKNLKMEKSCEQLAAEEEERQRVKQEKKRRLEEPLHKASKFLKHLPGDIETVKKALKTIGEETHLPASKKGSLVAEFEGYHEQLTKMRANLENEVAAGNVSAESIMAATADVTVMRKAFQALAALQKIYGSA